MTITLDCSACKSETTMTPTKIRRFNTILRIIGYIIVIPSLLGVAVALIMFFSVIQVSSETMSTIQTDAERAGAAIGTGIGFGMSIFMGATSLIGGLIGWLLLMRKKVFKCIKCGFVLDRD